MAIRATRIAPPSSETGKQTEEIRAHAGEHLERFRDLAPGIYRQRLIIEGTSPYVITREQIARYLTELSQVCNMTLLIEPVTHYSEQYGWAGWVHWATSGAHFYAWETPQLFFSVDIYTCKPFDTRRAVAFTRRFFVPTQVVAKTV